MALGAWSLIGVGCAGFGDRAADEAPRAGSREVALEPADGARASNASASGAAPRTPPRVVFADEPDPAIEPEAGRTSAQELSGAGLVDALAQSYETDRAALAAMQKRKSDMPGPSGVSTPAAKSREVEFDRPDAAAAVSGELPATTPATRPAITPATKPAITPAITPTPASAAAPAVTTPAPTDAATMAPATTPAGTGAAADPLAVPPTVATSGSGTPAPAPQGSAAVTQPVETAAGQSPSAPTATIQTNAALELPPAIPTDPTELARLLAESLIRTSAESETPLAQWLAFAALGVANPDLALPEDFGSDLLEAERARVRQAHAAFVALGRSLREGSTGLDKAAQENLLAALSAGPKLTIPKVDLCTRVEAFGRYSPIQNRRFLAGSTPRFIVYSEIDGFVSGLEEGRFVTRLATRVSIETERDGVEVWRRSPEWTASADRSDTRRGEFFLCEIVSLSEHLSVGGYRLKVEIRDESTGEAATQTLPFHVVADPTMVSVGD